jgi:hypothetical protein
MQINRIIEQITTAEDNNIIEFIIATESPIIKTNKQKQILLCNKESVDISAAKTIILNHEGNQVVGGITDIMFDNINGLNCIRCKGYIDEDAKFPTGVNVLKAMKSKMVTGFSVGGKINSSYLNNDGEEIVEKWELRESTITPIPADVNSVLIRQLQQKEHNMAEVQKNAEEVQKQLASLELQRDIALTAASMGLDADPYIKEESMVSAIKRMNADKAVKNIPNQQVALNATVQVDEVDKLNRAYTNGLLNLSGQKVNAEDLKGNPSVGYTRFSDLVRSYAAKRGFQLSNDNNVIARNIINRGSNTVTDQFSSYVLVNAMDKAVMNGYNAYGNEAVYLQFAKLRDVADYKTFYSSAVAVGGLTETPENSPFGEITKNDMGYSNALAMFGGTISLSEQLMVNDDLNQFMDLIARAGFLANREIDVQVAYVIENATWTGNTTGSATLATAGNLDKVRAAFRSKTDPSGKILGVTPKFLVHTPSQAKYAAESTWNVTAPGASALFSSPATRGMIPVENPFLTGTSTTYYLFADPMVADSVYVAFLRGQRAPVLEEQGITAVAGRAWNVKMPFKAGIASTTVAGTIYMPGAQQGTV